MNKNRFLQVLRWELLLSKRQITTMALTFFGMVVIPQILTLVFRSSSSSAYTMGILCAIALFAYMLCSGALIFSSLRSRQQRINDFMLPASNKEKFVARYLVLVVAMPLAAIAGFFVGDVLQYLMSLIINSDAAQWATTALTEGLNNSGIFHFYTNLDDAPSPLEGFFAILFGAVMQHACFLFFGSIFHKHPLRMAILTWMGLGIVLLMIGAFAARILAEFLHSGYTITLYDAWLKALYYIINIIIIVFCYRFAYHRYPRLQVINNQWINK